MRREQLLDVVLKLDFRMDPGPVVRCPNERQEKQQVLKANGAQQSFQGIEAYRGVRRLQKYMTGKSKNAIFHERIGSRYFNKRCGAFRTKGKARL
jgi:hypothetical protein